jgi:hypothetical protein
MKIPFLAGVILFLAVCLVQAAGPDLKVERRTLDREEGLRNAKKSREELIRGLHISVKNNSAKGMGEGEVEWAILVQHAGKRAASISSGKEKLKALGAAQMAAFVVGAVSILEQRNREQDMEYRVIVRQGGTETAKVQSTPHFDALAKDARSLDEEDKPRKGKKP